MVISTGDKKYNYFYYKKILSVHRTFPIIPFFNIKTAAEQIVKEFSELSF